MAAQVLHVALAEHDRTCTEPDDPNGTVGAIGKVLVAGGRGGRGHLDFRDAERD